MAKVYLSCGKISSGKTTHSKVFRAEHKAVILSVDEITLALFGQDAGDKLDYYVEKSDEEWYRRLDKRNQVVLENKNQCLLCG